jgi:hypothetical protein
MSTFQLILFTALLPALISGGVLFVSWRGWRRNAPTIDGTWGGPIAIGLGYVLCHAGTIGFPPFPAVEATQWLIYIAFVAIGLGLLESRLGERASVRWGIRLLISAVIPFLLLQAVFKYRWGIVEGILGSVGLSAAILAFWTQLDALAERQIGGFPLLVLLSLTAGGSVVLVLSGSALLGQLSGGLASTLGAGLIMAWWQPKLTLTRGAITVSAALLCGLWLNGYFYAEVPPESALLLYIAPSVAWIRWFGPVQRLGRWGPPIVSVAAVLVLVGLAVGFALRASPPLDYDY